MIFGFGQPIGFTDVDIACGGIWTQGTIGELKALRDAAVKLASRIADSLISPGSAKAQAQGEINVLNIVWFKSARAYADPTQSSEVMPDKDIESICRSIGRIYALSKGINLDPLVTSARDELESVSMTILRRHLPEEYQDTLPPPSQLAPILYAGVALVLAGLVILYYQVKR